MSLPMLGVAYYPEQWPPERWAEDARLMRAAGLRAVRLAEFAWSRLEPAEGQFDFAWLDTAIATLVAEGHELILGTPTAAPPPWLTERYPEVLPVDERGRRLAPGSRRHVCLTSPSYRTRSRAIVERMALRYGHHPAVRAWQLDNELGGKDTSRCHCEACAEAFRGWLRARHGSLEGLNAAWGTVFWSQTYTAWSQVSTPLHTPFEPNPAAVLDYYRFCSWTTRTYLEEQVELLRAHSPGRELATNLMMGGFDVLDYPDLVRNLDRVGWDNYRYDGWSPARLALSHDWAWGLRQRNFWVLEEQLGQVNWTAHNATLAPGEARLMAYQAIAHGADALVFFRWRMARQGAEQYHSAVLPHSGVPGRIYAELQGMAQELEAVLPLLEDSAPVPAVAILQDYEDRWALRLQPHNQDLGPDDYLRPWYEALYRRNVPATVLHPQVDWSAFPLLIAPALHLVDTELAARLDAWVQAGGVLVLTCRSGFKDRSNQVWDRDPPGPLTELAGVRVVSWDSLGPERRNHVQLSGGTAPAVGGWCEVLEPLGAEVLGHYQADHYAGAPAVTRHARGRGQVIYVGTLGTAAFTGIVLEEALGAAGVTGWLRTPDGVEATVRVGPSGTLTFLLNHAPAPHQVAVPPELGTPLVGSAALPPWGVAIFHAPPRAPQNGL